MRLSKERWIPLGEEARTAPGFETLPTALREYLERRGEPIPLRSARLLARARETPRYAHFLVSGAASLVTTLRDGRAIQAGLVGPGALVEAHQVLGADQVFTEAVMAVDGLAIRVSFRDLVTAAGQPGPAQEYVMREMRHQGLLASQLIACSYYHELKPRLATLLLLLQGHARHSRFRLTQETLASMLGVRRTTLTVAAGHLQRSHLIQYSRGEITVPCAKQLAAVACECYGVISAIHSHRRFWDVCGPAPAEF